MRLLLIVVALPCITIFGCGPAEQTVDGDTVPVISNFVYQPSTVNTQNTFEVMCSIDYEDPDGDVEFMDFRYTYPDGDVREGDGISLPNELGVDRGTANFRIYVTVTVAGEYDIELWLLDKKQNESNHLSGTITAR